MRRSTIVLVSLCITLALAAAPAWARVDKSDDAIAAENTSAAKDEAKQKAVMGTINVTAKRYQAEDLETGAFTTVITAEDMEKKGGDNAYELLQRTEGINFSSSLPGGITQGGMNGEIGIRGIKGGEQIMMNGIPLIEPTAGAYDIDQIPASFLERIEVVKGSNSALYGSRAMTGVINMRTKRPGDPSIGGSVTAGSNAYWEGSASYRNDMLFVGANYVQYDELSSVKKYYSTSSPRCMNMDSPQKVSTLVSVQPWEPLVFSYMFNHTDVGYSTDYFTSPTSNYKVDETVYHHYVSAIYEKNTLKATAFYNYNYMELNYDYYGNTLKPGKTNEKTSFTTGVDLQDSARAWGTMFLYGGTYIFEQQDETRQDVYGSSSKGYYVKGVVLDHTRHLPSVFFQAEKTFWDSLILTLGIRGQGVLNTEEGSDDYFEPVPQFQAVYKLSDQHSIYGNVGRAFRVPTFNQLYSETATFVGNPELEPEYGWTYELGYKFEVGIFSGAVSAFMMNYTDKIRYVMDPIDERYYARNMDEYQTSGVEWKFALQVHDYINLTFGGYGADPWEEEDDVKQQAGPKWQMVPGVYFDNGPLKLGLNATIMLEREQNLEDYCSVNMTGSYQVNQWLRLKVKANNLLDKDLVVNGNMTPDYSSPYEVLDAGLWIYGGVEIDFSLL